MKNFSFFLTLIIIFLIVFYTSIFSQLTNKWEFVDISDILYINYFSIDANMSGLNENDIVVFGEGKILKKFTNKGNNNEIIYYDTINTKDSWNSISHPSNNLIVIVGDSIPLLVRINNWDYFKYFGLMIFSTDDGSTWLRKTGDSNTSYRCVSMCDSKNGIILQMEEGNYYNNLESNNDSLLITKDGWINNRKIPIPEKDYIYNIYCLSPNTFSLLYKNYIYLTFDGGITWEKSSKLDDNVKISDVKFINERKIFLTANRKVKNTQSYYEPIIYRSNDGGKSWFERQGIFNEIKEDTYSLNSIDFCDSLNGNAVGSDGKVLRTSDGGDTWSKEYAPYLYPETSGWNSILSVFYPKKDFAFALWRQYYTMRCVNNKILSKPEFYYIQNYSSQPVNNVVVKWTAVEGASRYRLKLFFENPSIDTILTDTSITLNNLNYSQFYKIWVKAIGDSIESDWTESHDGYGNFRTMDSVYDLYSPELIYPPYAARIESSKITLLWNKVPAAERYYIMIENDKNSDVVTESITDTLYTINNVLQSAFYYVTLRSYKGSVRSADNWSYFSTRAELAVEDELKNVKTVIHTYPLPFSNSFNIEFINKTTSIVSIDIYDILGFKVFIKNLGFLESGKHNIKIEPDFELKPGCYIVAVRCGGLLQYIKIIKG